MNLILLNNTIYINNISKVTQEERIITKYIKFFSKYHMIIKNHKILQHLNESDLEDLKNQIEYQYIKNTEYSDIFYKNFPEEVKKMSHEEIYFNSLIYYITGKPYGAGFSGTRLFNEIKKSRKALKTKQYKEFILKIESFNSLLTDLINLKQLSDYQLEIVQKLLISNYKYIGDINNIKSRENKALILKKKLENKTIREEDITSSNDLLYMTLISKIDDEIVKLKKPDRFTRRFILKKLEMLIQKDKTRVYSEIKRHKQIWKKIFNYTHVFEYNYENIKDICRYIYNNKNIPSDYTVLEEKIQNKDISLFKYFEKNPAEIYRRLNYLISVFDDSFSVIESFINNTVSKIPTDILCTLYKYSIITSENNRIIEFNNNLVVIDKKIENNIIKVNFFIKNELRKRFIKYESIDIEEAYLNISLPFKQKGTQQLNSTLSKGSRIKIRDGQNIRFFIYWKGTWVDIDLSVYLLNENYSFAQFISFSNLKTNGVTHSGDITSAPDGASEYIDVDFENIDKNVKYILMYVNNYSGQTFNNLKECFAGMMLRPVNNEGEIFDIKTVENTFKITTESTTTYPLLIDIGKKEIVVIDKTIKTTKGFRAAVDNLERDSIIAEFYTKKHFFTIKDYIEIMEIPISKNGEKFTKDILFNNLELTQKLLTK